MRLLVSLVLLAWPASGQFTNLTTDDTGSRVWFSSALRLRGTQQSVQPKIFMADMQGNVQLVAEAAPNDPYSILTNPEVSGDGAVLAYTARYNCPPGITCLVDDDAKGIVSTITGALTLPGTFHLSRNGRYVAREEYSYFGPTGQLEIVDLISRQTQDIPIDGFETITGGGRQVTSQGQVLAYADSLWLFGFDGTAQPVPALNFTIPAPSPFFSFSTQAAIDDAGDRIVYQSSNYQNGCEIDLTRASSTAQPTTLVTSHLPCTMQASSADGSSVLFMSADNFDGSNAARLPECWVADTTSKAITAVSHDPAGIAEATLSGDGKVVWAVTFAGRLIRIERSTGIAQEIIPQTTALDQPPFSFPLTAAAGALVHLTGRGLAAQFAASSVPLSTTVDGIQLLSDGQPLPLFSVSPSDIVFQVPWEMQGTHVLTLAGTQSPFEEILSRNLQIQPAAPSFWYTADGYPAIAHQDFHGLVSASDPAHPDEIPHLYLTGLGAVTPTVATGQASPAAPLSFMADPVYVSWAGELPINFPLSAKVLFAGLAPGFVALEQVDIQVPHESPAQLTITVQSGSAGTGATGATFPVAP